VRAQKHRAAKRLHDIGLDEDGAIGSIASAVRNCCWHSAVPMLVDPSWAPPFSQMRRFFEAIVERVDAHLSRRSTASVG
jgi:hypothetical protein